MFSINRTLQLVWMLALLLLAGGCVGSSPHPFTDEKKIEGESDKSDSLVISPVELKVVEDSTSEVSSTIEDLSDLSIEKAVVFALRYNRDLHVQQLQPVIAGTFEDIEKGKFDPELFADGEYLQEKTQETGSSVDVSSREATVNAGIRQSLPSGTDIEAGISQNRTISDTDAEEQEARLYLGITQSLLRGFGTDVNLAAVRQSELETQISYNELRGYVEVLTADTEKAYWQYVLAKDEIEIFEESLNVARKQREEIELSIDVGLLPEFEVAAARAEEAHRVQLLIDARSQLEDRRLRLLRLVSPDPDRYDQPITASSTPRIAPSPIDDLQDRLKIAEKFRPDLSEAHLRLQQRRLQTIVTRNGLLPKLDIFIALGITGYGDTFEDSFRQIDGDTYDIWAGLNLSHFLGSRASEAKNVAAYGEQLQAKEAIANLRQIVHLDVRLAVNEAERLRQQIDASRATRIFQEQTLNAEQERFAVGASTALLVAQAQRDLLEAQIAEVETIVNYRIALVNLYLAEGSLLERRGIQIN